MADYQLRLMREEDLDSVRNLFQRVYGHTRKPEEDRWRYLKTESGLAPVMLAEKDSVLVGSYAVWPLRIRCGGEMFSGAQALDIMVDPAHNGKGLFTKMGEALFVALEKIGVTLMYGFPNAAAYPGHIRKMRWHHVTDIPRYLRPIRPLNYFSNLPQWLRAITDIFKPSASTNYKITSGKPDDAALEAILRAVVFPNYSCHVVRDAKWFAWRYDITSGIRHEWLQAEKGFAVFREDALGDAKFLRISELWGDAGAVDALLRHIIRLAYARDALLVMFLGNIPALRKPLWRHLFFPLQKKPFIVRPLTASTPVTENWHIMSGDFDAM